MQNPKRNNDLFVLVIVLIIFGILFYWKPFAVSQQSGPETKIVFSLP